MAVLFCKRDEDGLPEIFGGGVVTDFDRFHAHWKRFGATEEQSQRLFEAVMVGLPEDKSRWKGYVDRVMGWEGGWRG